jgi:hypothetical protein
MRGKDELGIGRKEREKYTEGGKGEREKQENMGIKSKYKYKRGKGTEKLREKCKRVRR